MSEYQKMVIRLLIAIINILTSMHWKQGWNTKGAAEAYKVVDDAKKLMNAD